MQNKFDFAGCGLVGGAIVRKASPDRITGINSSLQTYFFAVLKKKTLTTNIAKLSGRSHS
ncbi:MAG: hypothetical protein LH628_13065 [Microcoleus sp. CAN_BIN18]|nr:hypothetical protein [Microcoleus sp. CAN_BIN18]